MPDEIGAINKENKVRKQTRGKQEKQIGFVGSEPCQRPKDQQRQRAMFEGATCLCSLKKNNKITKLVINQAKEASYHLGRAETWLGCPARINEC